MQISVNAREKWLRKAVFAFILLVGFIVLSGVSHWMKVLFWGVEYWREKNYYVAWGAVSLAWAFVCCHVARLMQLRHRNFFIAGLAWGELTISFLLIYPFIKAESKEKNYNYYSFSLGWIFLILHFTALFLSLFFVVRG